MKKKPQRSNPAATTPWLAELVYRAKVILALYRRGILTAEEVADEFNKRREDLGFEPRADMVEQIKKWPGRIE